MELYTHLDMGLFAITNLRLHKGAMKLYTHLGIGKFTITNLRLHNRSQRKYKRWRIYESGSGRNETIYTFGHTQIYDHRHGQIYGYKTGGSAQVSKTVNIS